MLRPTATAQPLTLNHLRAMVMTYSHAKVQSQWSLSSKVKMEMDGWMEPNALPALLMQLVKTENNPTEQLLLAI